TPRLEVAGKDEQVCGGKDLAHLCLLSKSRDDDILQNSLASRSFGYLVTKRAVAQKHELGRVPRPHAAKRADEIHRGLPLDELAGRHDDGSVVRHAELLPQVGSTRC